MFPRSLFVVKQELKEKDETKCRSGSGFLILDAGRDEEEAETTIHLTRVSRAVVALQQIGSARGCGGP